MMAHIQPAEKYWVLADQLVVSGAGFITSLLLARTLGPVSFGLYSGIAMVQLFLLSVTMAFTSQVYQVVWPTLAVADARRFTGGMLAQLLLFTCLLLPLGRGLYKALPATAARLGAHAGGIILIAALGTALYLLQDFLRRAFITAARARLALLTDVLNNLLQLCALCAAAYYHRLTLGMACTIMALAYLPAVITGLLLLPADRPTRGAAGFAWAQQKSKSGWLLGAALLQWGAGYFFVVAAGWYLGAAALGALRLAQYLFGLLNVLLAALESYALPRMAAHTANARAYCGVLLRKTMLLLLPLLALLCLFARQVLVLAGGLEYAQYAFVMYGLSGVYVLMALGYPVRIVIRSLHLHKQYFMAYTLSVAITIPAAPWLLRHWQLYGVLCGLLLTQLICIGYWLTALQRKTSFIWK